MKNLLSIFVLALIFSAKVFAGGGATSIFPIFSPMNGTQPVKYPCATGWTTGSVPTSTGIPGPLAVSACPGVPCQNPGFFALYYERYTFKNTLLTPQCITVAWTAVSPGTCSVSNAFTSTEAFVFWTAANAPCYAPTTVMGGSGSACATTSMTYSLEVPPCSDFTVVYATGQANRGTWNLSLRNGSEDATVGCSGAECIKTLTIGGTQVPTMTQWGLFLFGLIVLTLGVVAVFNMSRKSSNETAR